MLLILMLIIIITSTITAIDIIAILLEPHDPSASEID